MVNRKGGGRAERVLKGVEKVLTYPGEPTSLPPKAEVWGRVVKEVGIKGELKIQILPERAAYFQAEEELILRTTTLLRRFVVERLVPQRSSWRVKLKGIDNPDQATLFRGAQVIGVEPDEPRLEEGEFLVEELIGSQVFSQEGEWVGVIRDVINYPHHDVWVLEVNGKEMMIPAVHQVVYDVDLKKRRVIIDRSIVNQ